ncbi:MAG: hypothetical protein KJ767_04170 [Nanoarchaeota archaeon]|nr:hypothetical protein [Nanoarchaeota archaeon]
MVTWNKKYLPIHKNKKRGKGDKTLNPEELLALVRKFFDNATKEKFVKDLAKSFDDISCRIDLVGVPETSFVLAVVKGKLKFLSSRQNADMAMGIHKDFFLDLIQNPPKFGNIKLIYNNIIFRKGIVKLFKYGKPIFSSVLFSGNDKEINKIFTQTNKVAKVH